MVDLKKMQSMDKKTGRPEQLPGGSGFFNKDEFGPEDMELPPADLPPSSPNDDHGMEDSEWLNMLFGDDPLDDDVNRPYHGYSDDNDDDRKYTAAKRAADDDINAVGGSSAILARGTARKGNSFTKR